MYWRHGSAEYQESWDSEACGWLSQIPAPMGWSFKVLQKVGKVACRLELPSAMGRIHKVFYISLLKKSDLMAGHGCHP